MSDSDNMITWASKRGREIDADLARLADQRLGLRELERIAIRVATDQETLGVTLDALVLAHRDDPIGTATLQSIFARVLDPDTSTPTNGEDEDDRRHTI